MTSQDPIERVSLDKIIVTTKVPERVDAAVKLLCIAILFSIIGLVMNIALGFAPFTTEGMAVLFAGYALVGLLVLKISLGRNWARITFTMLLGFQIGGALLVAVPTFTSSIILGILYISCLGLQIAAVLMLFMKDSEPFFEKKPKA